jgi:hypothetical protein
MHTPELIESMKPVMFFLALLAVSTPTISQSQPAGVDLADPSTLASPQACIAECEAVFADCRVQCGETTARADNEHFDLPDVPVGQCLHACQVDLAVCKDTCGN